jgi:aryl-alcohol dehydrogenase-like predicted oxidoreductase
MKREEGIQLAAFGRTGYASTRAIFGGFALAPLDQDAADQALEVLLAYGVNHLDTAPSYGDSELRIGPWMDAHRRDFFLATKTDQRTFEGAQRQIASSLERLRVDQVDLLQLHNLIEEDEWQTAFGPDGALKAVVEARDQGLTRFIGVTGHSTKAPAMHLRSLEAFDFDSVLLPLNYPLSQNPRYAADFQALLKVCEERQVAVQTIKSVARRRWADPEARPLNTWYEPVQEQRHIDNAVQWVLGNWPVFLITAGEVTVFAKILDAAARLEKAPSDAEMTQMAETLDMQPMWL